MHTTLSPPDPDASLCARQSLGIQVTQSPQSRYSPGAGIRSEPKRPPHAGDPRPQIRRTRSVKRTILNSAASDSLTAGPFCRHGPHRDVLSGTPPSSIRGTSHDVRVRYAHSGSRRSVTHANRRASPRKNCILSLARTLFGRTGIFCYDSATDDTRCLSGRLVTGLRHYIASPCVQVENPNHGPYLLWYIPLLPDSSSSKKC